MGHKVRRSIASFICNKIDIKPKIIKCAPKTVDTLSRSCHEKAKGVPKLVSSNLYGPKIKWYIPPKPNTPDTMICKTPIIKNG